MAFQPSHGADRGGPPSPHRAGGADRMPKKQVDTVMTIEDLAAYLKLSKSTLYKLCQEGKVPGQKVGRHWRFHKAVIDRWLGDQE